jgi:hypothetical protein
MGDFNRDQFDLALKYAKDLWESVDIMEDQYGAFNIIRVHGVPHWESQGYKTVTKVRLTHVIEGRGAAQETRPEPTAEGALADLRQRLGLETCPGDAPAPLALHHTFEPHKGLQMCTPDCPACAFQRTGSTANRRESL